MTSAELLQKVFKSKARLEKVFQIGNTGGIFLYVCIGRTKLKVLGPLQVEY